MAAPSMRLMQRGTRPSRAMAGVVVDAVDSDRCAACVVACEKNHDVAAPDWRPQPSRDGVRRRCRFVVLHIEVVKERAASATARSPSPESTVSITSPIL
jgi:Fe-S-cluster-containing dehydrogenase component